MRSSGERFLTGGRETIPPPTPAKVLSPELVTRNPRPETRDPNPKTEILLARSPRDQILKEQTHAFSFRYHRLRVPLDGEDALFRIGRFDGFNKTVRAVSDRLQTFGDDFQRLVVAKALNSLLQAGLRAFLQVHCRLL